ncbi:MAG: DUF4126 domain-containing protein [Candidatus Calescibacterium sp.]|nr:DUF4126 domain-containing protein [Candidatus Calescibacterium sp.]MDW8132811.1 DUF4126 domain-containing protein [Candidatus Calescibacterium sp.]
MEWVFIVSFAIVLSASTGIRAFLPLTITALLAKFEIVSFLQTTPFINYITDDRVLYFLIAATVIEILSDKIPALDNFLDGIYFLIKPVLSFVSTYGIFYGSLELWQTVIMSITLTLASTSVSMGTKGTVRLISTTTTSGIANPLVSTIEDLIVIFKMVLGVIFIWTLPVLALISVIFTIFLVFVVLKIVKFENLKAFFENNTK